MTFTYEKPATLSEAIAVFGMHGGRLPILAGGTDLIVKWRSGAINPAGFIDVSGISGLKHIEDNGDSLEIGACATHASISSSDLVKKFAPVLADACASIGASQIQNRGTIGGNIVNASPAGDTLPVIAAYEAQFLAQNLKGERWIKMGEFYTSYRKTLLATDEILTRIRIPRRDSKETARFYKVGARRAQSISKVVMCVRGRIRHGGIEWIKIAIGSVAPTVVRCPGTEALLKGRAIDAGLIDQAHKSVMDEVAPIDDIRSTADYRRFICGSLLARFLSDATARDSTSS